MVYMGILWKETEGACKHSYVFFKNISSFFFFNDYKYLSLGCV